MITYNQESNSFHLKTKNTSYIFGFAFNKFLVHLYWGKEINLDKVVYEDFIDFTYAKRNMCACDYKDINISRDILPMEFSTFGNTDLRTPTFHAQYKDGSRITELEYVSHKIYKGKKAINGLPTTYVENEDEADTLELLLRDNLTGLEITLHYSVFYELDAITRRVSVYNGGKDGAVLKSVLSAVVDFNNKDYDFIHLPGAWSRERHVKRVPLFDGKQIVDSARGSSSFNHNPFFALAEKSTTENSGNVYGFNLVYSGNFTAGVEVDTYDTSRAFIGINPFDFAYVLNCGETFDSPEAVLVYSNSGLGGMSRIYHKLYRTRLCRGKYRDVERPVLINNWEATYMKFNEEKILDIAKKASEIGVELLVLDDGWFGTRNTDKSALGDWFVNTEKLPSGLSGLAKKINEMGMKFGLWFEPEMVSPDSDCYRANPDWCIHVKDRIRSEGRNQLVLDLSRKDVCDYIIKSVSDILSNANIEYVKWDYNRTMTNVGSALLKPENQGEFYHRYILGLYYVLETLVSRFPNVLFESCSSGGARFDPGMLYYMPQTWCSDDTDAIERCFIQHGTSMCYPYSSMGAHVSAVPNHQVGRTTQIYTRGVVAMAGQFGFELDLNKLSEDDLIQAAELIKTYKKYGSVFHKGDHYRVSDPYVDNYMANEFVSEDKNIVIVTIVGIKATPNDALRHIKLDGLCADAVYKTEDGKKYTGDFLMKVGLSCMITSDYLTKMIVFNKQ